MNSRFHAAIAVLGLLLFGAVRGEAATLQKRVARPTIHLTWNEPWGQPGATQNLVRACSDTTRVDTLYISFETTGNIIPLSGISAVLVIEAAAGDTLRPYWFFERGGLNAGAMGVDFDMLDRGECRTPWQMLVYGRVGYNHVGGRGRLDLSADVLPKMVSNLYPNSCFMFARVLFRHRGVEPDGCRQPVRVSWAAGRFRTTRLGSEDFRIDTGPDQSVTVNAPRDGVRRRSLPLAVQTFVPRIAPPSWNAMLATPKTAAPEKVLE